MNMDYPDPTTPTNENPAPFVPHQRRERLLSLVQVCEELELPVAWFRREIQQGRIPYVQMGVMKRFSADAVAHAIQERAWQRPSQGQE